MKILMVVHQFLPRHLAGTEVYTYRLAQALRARGHAVVLFFTEIRSDRSQYELDRGEFDGIPYFEAVHNRCFASFRHTYADPQMEQLFQTVLTESAPDLVHLQHLYLHSIGYIDIARRRGLPILYTLHEYMLMCLQHGLLLRPGAILCEGPEASACARCAAAIHPGLSAGDPGPGFETAPAGRWSRLVRRAAAGLRRALARDRGARAAAPERIERAFLPAVRRRQSEVKKSLEQVNLFIAPSRFLRDRFVDNGLIPPARIVHSDYGFFVEPFPAIERSASPVLRAGYVGTISEHKGVHLIVEAFRGIDDPGIECRIFGDLDVAPDFTKGLRASEASPNVRFMGRIENEAIARTLAELDLLIVPSIWFENSPLTIHEAFLAGVPVVTSDRGGMAELVEHGKSGLHFRLGDPADLRRQLLRVLREPGLLERLRAGVPRVKTIDEDAAETEQRYRSLLGGE